MDDKNHCIVHPETVGVPDNDFELRVLEIGFLPYDHECPFQDLLFMCARNYIYCLGDKTRTFDWMGLGVTHTPDFRLFLVVQHRFPLLKKNF